MESRNLRCDAEGKVTGPFLQADVNSAFQQLLQQRPLKSTATPSKPKAKEPVAEASAGGSSTNEATGSSSSNGNPSTATEEAAEDQWEVVAVGVQESKEEYVREFEGIIDASSDEDEDDPEIWAGDPIESTPVDEM